MPPRHLRIGTRGSPMALRQTALVRDRLAAAHPDLAEVGAIEIVAIRTTGDRVQDRLLAEIGGKGLFAKEIEEALIARHIDLAVHSLKDLETWLPAGLAIACVLPRDDPRDAFLSTKTASLAALPNGARIGTASLSPSAPCSPPCRTPIAGLAEFDGDRLMVEGLLLKPDGSSEIRGHREGALADAEALETELGRTLRDRAVPGFWLG